MVLCQDWGSTGSVVTDNCCQIAGYDQMAKVNADSGIMDRVCMLERMVVYEALFVIICAVCVVL